MSAAVCVCACVLPLLCACSSDSSPTNIYITHAKLCGCGVPPSEHLQFNSREIGNAKMYIFIKWAIYVSRRGVRIVWRSPLQMHRNLVQKNASSHGEFIHSIFARRRFSFGFW